MQIGLCKNLALCARAQSTRIMYYLEYKNMNHLIGHSPCLQCLNDKTIILKHVRC